MKDEREARHYERRYECSRNQADRYSKLPRSDKRRGAELYPGLTAF